MTIEGSGSINQRHGSADPDPDPHQNVMDPQHCPKLNAPVRYPPNTLTIFSKRKNPTTERAPTRPMWTVRWCCSWWCSPPAINQYVSVHVLNQSTVRWCCSWWCSPPAINQCMHKYLFSINQLTNRRSFPWWCSPPAINQYVSNVGMFSINQSLSADVARAGALLQHFFIK